MRNISFLAAAVSTLAFGSAAQANPAVAVGVEAAGVQATTKAGPTFVEDFSTRSSTNNNGSGTPYLSTFTSNFGGGFLNATFEGFELGLPNSYGGNGYLYGGAFGSEKYGVVHGEAKITLDHAVGYLGMWAAALDGNNTVELLSQGVSLGSFNLVNTIGSLGGAYFGNPNNGGDTGEAFAFVNFSSNTPFDEIRFHQAGGGFEFDNVTFGNAVPEPATWALMIAGFGMAGAAARRRKSNVVFA